MAEIDEFNPVMSMTPDREVISPANDVENPRPGQAGPDIRPLTTNQERNLVNYLEGQLLEITRNYKKRSQPSSTLPSLKSYLIATRPLLSLILQIPPLDPSASLRTSLLLRLTGEIMNSIPGYVPDTQTLAQLLAWLDDLDKGWLAVLRSQAWGPIVRTGTDVTLPADNSQHSTPASQTDRTRLRSILVAGTSRMEEWLQEIDMEGQSYELALERLGLQQGFDELFSGTLAEMGSLTGSMNDPQGMEGTC
ncbi:hypothetical protein AcW1_005253 [Taiwanofungus camphoratus]|nr:hypothetical protein AcW2_004023 [Antrodia cinnamomea]KAI0956618.1 hypothetical protein AcW1_005253 [Antrodia cinnamomea]